MAGRGASRDTKSLVSNYVSYRVSLSNPPRGAAAADEDEVDGLLLPAQVDEQLQKAIRDLTSEFEQRYEQTFNELCSDLFVTASDAQLKFLTTVQTLFSDGINWGRIVALLAFGGSMAAQCVQKEMPYLVDPITDWVTQYIDRHLMSWIIEHGEWDGLVEFYKNSPSRSSSAWPSFGTLCRAFGAIGIGVTLGAILAHK